MDAWRRILDRVEHEPLEAPEQWGALRELASIGYPKEPLDVGGRSFFAQPDDELENWPDEWVPLQTAEDHATVVCVEGEDGPAVWIGRREGKGPELDHEPVFDSLEAFLDAVDLILENAKWETEGSARWLTGPSEDVLWRELPDASKHFDFFRLETRAGRIRFLVGEIRSAFVLTLFGVFFTACTLAFLAAPFGSVAVRVGFVAVVGCVPLALALYGYRALAKARAGLARLTTTGAP